MTTPPPDPPVVFAGPTLGGADVRRVVPGAVVLPPARCGDVLAALRLQPSAIVLIDGYYDTTPAPWHKELLWVLEAGIPVVGAASMGALRAAELDSFGMIGVGDVYASYRDGWRLADDEVAILHTPSPGDERAVTDALVDIEAKTDALVAGGLLDAGDAEAVATGARRCHFTERRMAGALDAAGQPPSVGERLLGWLAAQPSGGSRKRADAEAALRLAAGGLQRPRPHERLARTVHILRLAADASLRPFGQPDSRLPQAEQLLAADGALARAAAIAGGVLRVADSVSATPVDGVPDRRRGLPRPSRGDGRRATARAARHAVGEVPASAHRESGPRRPDPGRPRAGRSTGLTAARRPPGGRCRRGPRGDRSAVA